MFLTFLFISFLYFYIGNYLFLLFFIYLILSFLNSKKYFSNKLPISSIVYVYDKTNLITLNSIEYLSNYTLFNYLFSFYYKLNYYFTSLVSFLLDVLLFHIKNVMNYIISSNFQKKNNLNKEINFIENMISDMNKFDNELNNSLLYKLKKFN